MVPICLHAKLDVTANEFLHAGLLLIFFLAVLLSRNFKIPKQCAFYPQKNKDLGCVVQVLPTVLSFCCRRFLGSWVIV